MSIKEVPGKIKLSFMAFVSPIIGLTRGKEKDIFLIILIILTGAASFGLGRLSKLEEARIPIKIKQPASVNLSAGEDKIGEKATISDLSGSEKGRYVASKSGTKYHYPWCPSAKTIREDNKVWFDSKEAAETAGYTPAKNCPGL